MRTVLWAFCAFVVWLSQIGEPRCLAAELAAPTKGPLMVAGTWSGYPSQTEIAKRFLAEKGIRAVVTGVSYRRGFEYLEAGEHLQVLMYSPNNSPAVREAWTRFFPDEDRQPKRHEFGQFVVCVFVHPNNPVKRMTYAQLRKAYSGEVTTWREDGGQARKIELVGEHGRDKSYEMIKTRVLGEDCYFAKGFQMLKTSEEVAAYVAKHPAAIGFCMDRRTGLKGVRLLELSATDEGPYYAPTPENIFSKKYPLRDELVLLTWPGNDARADAYCKYACGPVGAEVAKTLSIYHEVERQRFLGKLRLADVKAGKGAPVAACGVAGGETLLKDLTMKYVEAKEAVQVTYQKRKTCDEAVARFREGGVDLLLVDGGRLEEGGGDKAEGGSDKAEGGGRKAEDGKSGSSRLQSPTPNPQSARSNPQSPIPNPQPRSVLLGKMALGIIVHPENKLESLALDDLRKIGRGDTKNWPAGSGAGTAIRAYGLPAADPLMQLFKEKVVGQHRALKITAQADTAKVVLTVARDPAGIGFVDLSQMPQDDKSVKLLPVTDDIKPRPPVAPVASEGDAGKGDSPVFAETKTGTVPFFAAGRVPDDYLLAQPYVLYVSADAGKTAQDLADYLAANPNAEVLAQHRLLPPPAAAPAAVASADEQHRRAPGVSPGMLQSAIAIPGLTPEARQEELPAGKSPAESKTVPAKPSPAAKTGETVEQSAAAKSLPGESKSGKQPASGAGGANEQVIWILGGVGVLVLAGAAIVWLSSSKRRRPRRRAGP